MFFYLFSIVFVVFPLFFMRFAQDVI